MAFDGIVIHAVAKELNNLLLGGKIDKIHQPEKDTVTINVRTREGMHRLLLCANPSCARVHLLHSSMENPMQPPTFCMLMRKHLSGGKITSVEQEGFERIIKIKVESYDEMGFLGEKVLICELMGKYSNIILTNCDGKIIDSVFHVDLTMSSVRTVLPGLIYTLPPSQGKENPLDFDKNQIKESLEKSDVPLFKQLMDTFCGISPLMAREAVYAATGDTDKCAFDMSAEEFDKVGYIFYKMIQNVSEGAFCPTVVADGQTGKLIDFNALAISQFANLGKAEQFNSVNEAAEAFYLKKSSMASLKQKSADLTKLVNSNLERCRRKLQIENETLEKVKKKEKYKIYGDLITANIYRIEAGMREIECENFYSPECEKIKIPLKYDLTPSQNAQRCYIKYTKEKTAEAETKKQREINLKEIDYLESVSEAITLAETGTEIAMIREELAETGYVKRKISKKAPKKVKISEPMHFVSDDGFDIFVGKNNKQNDYVTLKLSRSTDIWFHTKSIHGSHAIVKTSDAMTVPERTYVQAASLAAYYSKARNSKSVPVDYTEVKYVKKPSGAKPGMVIYTDYNTIFADPDEELAKRLSNSEK